MRGLWWCGAHAVSRSPTALLSSTTLVLRGLSFVDHAPDPDERIKQQANGKHVQAKKRASRRNVSTLESATWRRHLATTLGDTTWRHHLATPLGDTAWRHHLATPLGYNTWPHHFATPLGDTTWRHHFCERAFTRLSPRELCLRGTTRACLLANVS